jgi:hypothetical protein
MSGYGVICGILGMVGATAWFAVYTIAGQRSGRYEGFPWGVVPRSRRPKMFHFITSVHCLIVAACGTATLWLIWLTWEYSQLA